MRSSSRTPQTDLFSFPASLPRSLPATARAELVTFLSTVFEEVLTHQRRQNHTPQESAHEPQDHA